MYMALQRIFGTSSIHPADPSKPTARPDLAQLRASLHAALHDCTDMQAQRMIYKINVAQTAAELWQLRSDLYQCISQVHSQAVAAERVNALIPAFEGLLPARQITRI